MPKKILFITSGMQTGGAERQLVLLANGMKQRGHSVTIISLSTFSDQQSAFDCSSLIVLTISLRKSVFLLSDIVTLLLATKRLKPEVIQGWMYTGNIISSLVATFLRKPHLHSLRASNMDTSRYWGQIKLNAFLSTFPRKIVANSHAGQSFHEKIGFKRTKLTVVGNAIDTNYFKPNQRSADVIRKKLHIPKEKTVILYAARLDPMKAHNVVIRLAEILEEVCFIFSGKGTDEIDLPNNVIGLGIVADMPALYNAADLLVNFSHFGEGFPNVICEALACGIPVLANDIGDTRRIIGDEFTVDNLEIPQLTRRVHAIFQDEELDAKIASLRQKTIEAYSIETMLDEYEKLYV